MNICRKDETKSGNFTFPLQPTSILSLGGHFPFLAAASLKSPPSSASTPPHTNLFLSSKCPLALIPPLFSLGTRISSLVSGLHDAPKKPNPPIRWGSPGEKSEQIPDLPIANSHAILCAVRTVRLKPHHPNAYRKSRSIPLLPQPSSFINIFFRIPSNPICCPCQLGSALRQIDVAAAECLRPNSGAAIQLHKSPQLQMLDGQGSHMAIELEHSHGVRGTADAVSEYYM